MTNRNFSLIVGGLLAGLFASGASATFLDNGSFEIAGPNGSVTSFTGSSSGGGSAADRWGVFNNTDASTTTELVPSTLAGGGDWMIHVTTDGARNGLNQLFDGFDMGPADVTASAWVYVVSGEVGIGTGNQGNTAIDTVSTTNGQWELLEAPNQSSPANAMIIFSSEAGPAEFYVEMARVVPEPGCVVLAIISLPLILHSLRRRKELAVTCLFAIVFGVAGSSEAFAQNKHWVGGADGNWENWANWSPIGVPTAGDWAYVENSGNQNTVDLNAPVNVWETRISGGMTVRNNGNRFAATAGGNARRLTIADSSTLALTRGTESQELFASRFDVSGRSNLSLVNSRAQIAFGDSSLDSGSILAGSGDISFNNFEDLSDTNLENSGTIASGFGDLTLRSTNGNAGAFDLDGPQRTGILDADDGTGLFAGATRLSVRGDVEPFAGQAIIGTADTLHISTPWTLGETVDGGQMTFNGRSGVATLSGGTLSVVNQGTEINVASGIASIHSSLELIEGRINLAPNAEMEFHSETAFEDASFTMLQQGSSISFNETTNISSEATFGGGTVVNNLILRVEEGLNMQSFVENVGTFQVITTGLSSIDPVDVAGYSQSSRGTLRLDLEGDQAGEYEVLRCLFDTASLDGTLEVTQFNFSAGLGDEFTIIVSQVGIQGTFSNLQLPSLPGSLEWDVIYGPTTVKLRVVEGIELVGDFDQNGMYDCADVDALVAEIAAGTNDVGFDLTVDALVDADDLTLWLEVAGDVLNASGNAFLYGDANLDGVVDVSDFNIWNSNKFTPTAAWCSGDFNADGSVDVSDFNLWNGNKFQDVNQRPAAVPEPSSGFQVLWLCVCLLTVRSKVQIRNVRRCQRHSSV